MVGPTRQSALKRLSSRCDSLGPRLEGAVISTHSRRRFLRIAAGASVLPSLSFLQRAPSTLWAVDAGNVRVFPAPWTVLPASTPGVRLESLRLRMPDGVHLHALIYLPDDLKRRGKIPGVLNTTPYRNMPRATPTSRERKRRAIRPVEGRSAPRASLVS